MEEEDRVVYPGQLYRHFKGNMYQIIAVATHSETNEKLVIYQKLYGNYKIYARPYDMFLSEVDHIKYPEVTSKYRFELVNQDLIVDNTCRVENIESKQEQNQEQKLEQKLELESEQDLSEGEANPILLQFLDAKSYEDKRALLVLEKDNINDRLIDDLAASMDVAVDDGDLETRYRSLINCIDTMARFEVNRLR